MLRDKAFESIRTAFNWRSPTSASTPTRGLPRASGELSDMGVTVRRIASVAFLALSLYSTTLWLVYAHAPQPDLAMFELPMGEDPGVENALPDRSGSPAISQKDSAAATAEGGR